MCLKIKVINLVIILLILVTFLLDNIWILIDFWNIGIFQYFKLISTRESFLKAFRLLTSRLFFRILFDER